jgi:hypothetical protein
MTSRSSDDPKQPADPQDAVQTPAGPVPKDQIRRVEPGEAVLRTPEGANTVVSAASASGLSPARPFVVTPGGFRDASLVHLVEPGHVVDAAAGRQRKLDPAGKLVADLGPVVTKTDRAPLMPLNVVVAHPSLPFAERLGVASPIKPPALGSGWITYAYWNNGTGTPITSFRTTWAVPPNPSSNDGELIYIFNGIQNSNYIFQPVLQYGNNGAFGGNYWCVASWYADGQGGTAFHSPPTQVSVGQSLLGIMTQTPGSQAGRFNGVSLFQGIAASTLTISNQEQLTWCAETLEAYNVQQASDYPNALKCAMTGIEILTGSTHPALSWTPATPVSDTGQHTVIVSNSSPGGEVDLYFTQPDCIYNKTTILSDTSPKHPSIASLGGRLYIAWKGDGNDNLNVMYSADNGATFGHKYTSGETSPEAPSICVHNNRLYIAWKGDGNNHLNIAIVNVSGTTITGFTNKVTLGDTSPVSPAIASFGGRLYIAWKGDGNNNLNVMYSADNGATFGHKLTSGETSSQAPGLGTTPSNLFITWKGNGNDNLNVAAVALSGSTITGLANKVTLGETSPVSPALGFVNGRLYLSWKGDGNDFLNVLYSTDNGHSFGHKGTSRETSPQPPALCGHNGAMYVAWKGDGNDYLNVAQVRP